MPCVDRPRPARVLPSGAPHTEIAHAEDGHLEPSVEFDYDEIDCRVPEFHVEPEEDPEEFTAEEIEAACKVFTRLVQWIWQNGMRHPEGITIRAIVVCWVFLAELRPLNLTQMAGAFGKKKQSLGRWVDDFKRAFPAIRIAHMKE
jgi:hypothetical protein